MGLFQKLFGNAPQSFTVYDSGTDGSFTYLLKVGENIDSETATKLARIADGTTLYAVHYYRNGKKEKHFVRKEVYLEMKSTMDAFE